MRGFTRSKALAGIAMLSVVAGLAISSTPAVSDDSVPVDVRVLAVDSYTKVSNAFLEETATQLRKQLEGEVNESRRTLGIVGSVAPGYQAIHRLSEHLGLVRVGFHDGLHQVTVIGWKDNQTHLVQCRDFEHIDLETGPCGAKVDQVFGKVVNNRQIPLVWTAGIHNRYRTLDIKEGVGLKAESAPIEQAKRLTMPLLQDIADHVRSQTTDSIPATVQATQQDVRIVERNGESVGLIKLVRKEMFDVRIVVVQRDDEWQRLTCMHRLDDTYRAPESGPCGVRVRELFGFSL